MKCQRAKFMLSRKVSYLNCAYMSPMMKKVENAGIKGIGQKRKPYQVSPDNFFRDSETLRLLYSEIINNPEPKRVVIIPSVSYGIANVTNNLQLTKGDNIIVTSEQFPSNIYPWMSLCERTGAELKVVSPDDQSDQRGRSWNERLLQAIDPHTRVVAAGHVHWADGTVFDLPAIRQRTLDVGALLVIDGTQSVGALPIDIDQLQPDALICAGYKWLMGPYSIGLAYYGPRLDDGDPIEQNWINRFESEKFENLVNYQEEYQPGALRYEVGEHSNFILVPMLLEAIRQIRRWTVEGINDYCRDLSDPFLDDIRSLGFSIEDENYRSSHLFGLRLAPHHKMERIQKSLKHNRVSVSVRGSSIRVAPHVYNDELDFKRLIRALNDAS